MTDLPVILFNRPKDWAAWIEKNHAASPGVWLRIAKKGSGLESVTYAEALDVALCYGWIDGLKRKYDEQSWIQKFTPRRPRSLWSKINRAKAEELIACGRMHAAGLVAIEAARADGRWETAYDSASKATVPDDFQAALDRNRKAKTFFAGLDRANRYAILFRIQTAKKAETRAARIAQLVAMLERGEKIHGGKKE